MQLACRHQLVDGSAAADCVSGLLLALICHYDSITVNLAPLCPKGFSNSLSALPLSTHIFSISVFLTVFLTVFVFTISGIARRICRFPESHGARRYPYLLLISAADGGRCRGRG